MEEIVLQKIDEIADEMTEGIKSIKKIKSVRTKSTLNYPFGKNIDDCLNATLSLAEKLGFETENVDHVVGIDKYGKGDDYIGIMGHLDVFETGEGWTTIPFPVMKTKREESMLEAYWIIKVLFWQIYMLYMLLKNVAFR